MFVNMCHISQGPIILVPGVMSLRLAREIGWWHSSTHVDLMCNMVCLKGLLGDARMEGYMEVRKHFWS